MAAQRAVPGGTYGRWTLVRRLRSVPGGTYWEVRCVCGVVKEVQVSTVLRGLSTSCGCHRNELTVARSTTHGHAVRGHNSETYRVWAQMLDRCARHPRYAGVKVCRRWFKYENFLADMGEKPKGMTLDRKSNAKGYSPSNCRWATQQEQQNNRTNNRHITYRGQTQTLAAWCRELSLNYKTVYSRLYSGHSVEHAFRK